MQSYLRCRVGMLAVGSVILAGLGASAAAAVAPTPTATVAGSSAWYSQAYENFPTGGYLTPQQQDVSGPQRAPFGTSSHRMTVGESSAQTELYRTNAYDGAAVSDLTRLEYSTLARRTSGNGDRQPVYMRLSVDTNGDQTLDDTLFFFPANNGAVVNGQWQNWDVAGGEINVNGDGGTRTTLAAYASNNPGAKLVNDPFDDTHEAGSLSLVVGGALGGDGDPQTRGEYFVDRVIVGANNNETLFDFGGNDEVAGQNTDVTVDPANHPAWAHQAYDANVYLDSNQTFVDGPATPPNGGGSLKLSLDADENAGRVELFRTAQYDDTLVRDLREIGFSTFQRGTTAQQPAYLRLSVDNNGDGGTDDTLFFYPANNGDVAQSTWQTWDAAAGVWGVNGDPGLAGSVSLDDYVVAHPDATIVENGDSSATDQPKGGVAFVVGGGGTNQVNGEYFLDDITVGVVDAGTGHTVTSRHFDLEPTAPTLSVDNASISEGNDGATLSFPVKLSRAFTLPVTVAYATSNGTAKSEGDYRSKSGTVTIPAGSTSWIVSVAVASDKVREANESMSMRLSSPTNATIADGTAAGMIVDDDTLVAFALARATERRVRVAVSTWSATSGAPVMAYRVLKSGRTQVLNTHLDRNGRMSLVLGKHYKPGAKVTMYATVRTANGLYVSSRASITTGR